MLKDHAVQADTDLNQSGKIYPATATVKYYDFATISQIATGMSHYSAGQCGGNQVGNLKAAAGTGKQETLHIYFQDLRQ